MFGFIFGKKKFLGIDIGTSSLKIVELELRNDRPYLSNYAWMPIPDITEKSDGTLSAFLEGEVPKCIKKMIKEARLSEKKAFMSIPALGAIITLIDFPEMPLADMNQAIEFEAHKYIPTSLDEVIISWEIVSGNVTKNNSEKEIKDEKKEEKNSPEGKIQILLIAASKSKILAYKKIAEESNLKLKGIEIESLSMVNSLVGNDRGRFIIVDIGFRTCNIICVDKGLITANRNIDAGGEDFTQIIAKGLGINSERAEFMKTSGKNFFSPELRLHFSSLDLILDEIIRILEVLPKSEKGFQLDALILSGGTAGLSGLKDYFQEKLNVRTIIGDPFGRVDYDKKIDPIISKMKSRFSVSVGLALRGIEKWEHEKNK